MSYTEPKFARKWFLSGEELRFAVYGTLFMILACSFFGSLCEEQALFDAEVLSPSISKAAKVAWITSEALGNETHVERGDGIRFATLCEPPAPFMILLRGASSPTTVCKRCARTLQADPGTHFSNEIALEVPQGHAVFDGCVYCLADTIAAGGSR